MPKDMYVKTDYQRKGPDHDHKSNTSIRSLRFIESLAREHTEAALGVLTGIMNEESCPPLARVAAAKVILERGWGKPRDMNDREDTQRLMKIVREIVHVNGLNGDTLVKDPAEEEPLVIEWSDRNGNGHAS